MENSMANDNVERRRWHIHFFTHRCAKAGAAGTIAVLAARM
jgi:hypothetical protein